MQKILSEGVQLWQCLNVVVFLNIFMKGGMIELRRSSSAHQQNTI